MYKILLTGFVAFCLITSSAKAQNITITRQEMIELTPKWKGERFADGRPKVSDDLLERLKSIPLEQAWGALRGEGYLNQYETNWVNIHAGEVLVGRALTAQYMPLRPEVREQLEKKAAREGRIGDMVSWPIDMLVKGDVYVADSYGKLEDGPIIGSNLGTAILSRSGNGVVFNGTVRDMRDLAAMPGFTSFVRGDHPSHQREMMLKGINVAIRIGPVTVLPGDVVLGYLGGVAFIPPHLVERVVKTGEIVLLRDEFGQLRLREGKYTPGQIDDRWSDAIEKDFSQWLDQNPGKLKFSKAEMQELLKNRTW
ncbi:MAG: RraA family protein [Chitinophagaceae bacterium]|nr:RraA family protein [Chitinophagaceae bacterium]